MTPVIIISGDEVPMRQLISAGVNDFMMKPFDTTELSVLIRKWIDLARNELR
jgi:FixJ family two-component response regulator